VRLFPVGYLLPASLFFNLCGGVGD
jgi:hypothetical protein